MNIHGQTKLPTVKQLQIQYFIKYSTIDILQMQEINIDDELSQSAIFPPISI